MKRSLVVGERGVFEASISQSDVPGGATACTTIAVTACMDALWPRFRVLDASEGKRVERILWHGGTVHNGLFASKSSTYMAHAKEVVDLVMAAWPIDVGEEHGGLLSQLDLHDVGEAAVLTIGAISMAVLRGGTELLDSHAQAEHGGHACLFQFETPDDLKAYLLQRFPHHDTVAYSLTCIERRDFRPVRVYPNQAAAIAAQDELPLGCYHLFARDVNRHGAKQYLVAGLEDAFEDYRRLPTHRRCAYEILRALRPVSMYLDAEFERYEENDGDARAMLEALLILTGLPRESLHVYDACSRNDEGGPEAMLISSSSEEEEQEEQEEEEEDQDEEEDDEEEDDEEEEDSVSASLSSLVENDESSSASSFCVDEEDEEEEALAKVSFHIHSHALWFPNVAAASAWVAELEQKTLADPRLKKLLFVWKKVWDAGLKAHVMEKSFFVDMGVYTPNRCFREPYASKFGQKRPLLPLDCADNDVVDVDELVLALISPPSIEFFRLSGTIAVVAQNNATTAPLLRRASSLVSSSSSLLLSGIPPLLQPLGQAVAQHFRPQQMRGCQVTPNGLLTFSMIKHDCDICQDVHNNQVYVIADLKRRVMYSKCHADRTKRGAEVPFPASVGSLSMAQAEEAERGQRLTELIFPAQSSTARMVLGFSQGVFTGARTVPPLPLPGTAAVVYDRVAVRYTASMPQPCPKDQGALTLRVALDAVTVHCSGRDCSKQGRRWTRPSGSVEGGWNLAFLFVEGAGSGMRLAAHLTVEDFPAFAGSPQAALDEANMYQVLGYGHMQQVPVSLLTAHLKQMRDWVTVKLKEEGDAPTDSTCQLLQKVNIMERILSNDEMEACYRECLTLAPDFAYPLTLLPRSPVSLVIALWMHISATAGYKRMQDDFYLPIRTAEGRVYYKTVALKDVLTSVCSYSVTPNLCDRVLWNGRAPDDLQRMLRDENHFPSLDISKRYLGFSNLVYDLEANTTLEWETVCRDPSMMPFNFLDKEFPVEALEEAKKTCPTIEVDEASGELKFVGGESFCPTPLFDQPLHDQHFDQTTIWWLCAMLGRLFFYLGKQTGDNWEVVPFLLGAPGSFKSSILALVASFFQKEQVGVIGTDVEPQFPLDGIPGKMVAIMAEAGGCTLKRELFKQMASGEAIKVNTKHKTAINLAAWVIPLLLAGNSFFKMLDVDGSVGRRMAMFPFCYMLGSGVGATDLAQRIFREEGPLVLIKWITLYLAIRRSVNGRVQSLMPALIKQATREAIAAEDSLKCFFMFELVVTGQAQDQLEWPHLWTLYKTWCRQTGRTAHTVDVRNIETQAMVRGMGIQLSHASTLVGVRQRRTDDPPVQSVLRVGIIGEDAQPPQE